MKKIRYLLLILLFATRLTAQQPLPHFKTAEEAAIMPSYLESFSSNTRNLTPTPPPLPVRTMAEWEELQALVITWRTYPAILTEIVRHAVKECKVIIVASNPAQVAAQLGLAGIELDNVAFIDQNSNSVWIRDYGPWSVYMNDVDSLALVDWIYNRPRPLDDGIPSAVGAHLNLPIFEATTPPFDWIHTGGNHLRDGLGTAFSSDLVLLENSGKTERDINEIAKTFLGVDNYIKFPFLPYDGIHHIDMHMRIIDEETIIFGEYPDGVADGPDIQKNIDYLRAMKRTPFGNQYHIIRIPMPPDGAGLYPDQFGDYRTYSNALFLNKSILVPIYEEQYDTIALRIYEENLPGYKVVGIDCNEIIPAGGALHCITKMVGVNDPLWIAHPRLRDTYDTENDYSTFALIKHKSGISQASLFYRIGGDSMYAEVPMALSNTEDDLWLASIPVQSAGTEIQYYIHALANSGKEQVRPLVAPSGYFRFKVKSNDSPPHARIYEALDNGCAGQTLQFRDLSEGLVSSWSWTFPGGQPETSTEKNPVIYYSEAGVYDVMLIVANAMGSDSLLLEDFVHIKSGAVPFSEDFTNGPNEQWEIENEYEDEATWELTNSGNCTGPAFFVDNFTTDTRNTSDFFRARIDLTNMENTLLTFDVAYTTYFSNGNELYDFLRINAINCDGEKSMVYVKDGLHLKTAPGRSSAFIPQDCSEWRRDTVDLSGFDGQTIAIEFENVGGWGNRLYIDNINWHPALDLNAAPTIELTSPLDGLVVDDTIGLLVLEAEADDIDGVIAEVTFFVDGDSLGTDAEAPYTFDFEVPSAGIYTFRARATDDDGAFALSEAATLTVSQTTDLVEILADGLSYSLFPNPAKGQIRVTFDSSKPYELQYRLLDLLGYAARSGIWQLSAGENRFEVDLESLPAGTYFLLLYHPDFRSSRKVLKQR